MSSDPPFFPPQEPPDSEAGAIRPVAPAPTADAGAAVARGAPADPPGFGIRGAIGLCIVWLFLQLVGVGIYLLWTGMPDDIESLIKRLELPNAAFLCLSTLVLLLIVCRGGGARRLALRGCTAPQLAVVVLLVFPLILTNLSIADWTGRLLSGDSEPSPESRDAVTTIAKPQAVAGRMTLSEMARNFYGGLADRSWPIVLFFFCLLPALGEEPFFRGLLGQGLGARYGAAGVGLASAAFAASHVNLDHMGATLFLGVVLQMVYLLTRSLAAPIVLHFLNNLAAVGPDKYFRDTGLDPTGFMRFDYGIPSELTAASVLAVGGMLCLLQALRTRWILPDGQEWSPGYLSAEMPPADVAATRAPAQPETGAVVLPLLAWGVFAAVYVWQAFYVLPAPVAAEV